LPQGKNIKDIRLKVGEARLRDVGKARVRLDKKVMEELCIIAGDVVELVGKEITASIAWPADREDRLVDTLRIDGQTRKNAGVSVNEHVLVRKAQINSAKSITIIPLSGKLNLNEKFIQYVRIRLNGFPLMNGDEISIPILGSNIFFNIEKIKPNGIVKIIHDTKITILDKSKIEKMVSPRVTYEEVGGLREVMKKLREIVELPLRRPEVFKRLGIDPPRGILLRGPPGGGKTLLAKALASESEAEFFIINGPEIMNKYYGETEANLRDIFKEAKENSPSIVFIDEIDAIAPKREDVFGDVEKRVVAQLLSLMDGLLERGDVVVIGATNRIDSIDPALRRPGRFDREVEIGVPNADGRLEILQIHTRGMPLDNRVDLQKLALESHGYTGADLRALCREAALRSIRRYMPEIEIESETLSSGVLEKMVVKSEDFHEAFREIVPTAMREFYIETPSIGLGEIGGLISVKRIVQENIVSLMRDPGKFERAGVKSPRGVLFYGPPGCGKTLLGRAIASECGTNIIIIHGPELMSKWTGESEKAVRDIFRKAKMSSPCIIFFDEIDSIARSRSQNVEDSGVNERILSQLLTEMDGSQVLGDIFVLGATNRPDLIDPSLLRPGRLDLMIYIPPPDEVARFEILQNITKRMSLNKDVDLKKISESTVGYSGADLDALCREATISAMRVNENNPKISSQDFEKALKNIKSSISPEVDSWYESVAKQIKGVPNKQKDRAIYR